MVFPKNRLRRLRSSAATRSLMRETRVHPHDLIAPLFVVGAKVAAGPIASMPGQRRLSVDQAVAEAASLYQLGIRGVLLFGVTDQKDAIGKSAWDPKGPVPKALRALKKEVPGMTLFSDVCLCEYTDHGHCGVVKGQEILNDPSLPLLAKMAVVHAEAGADFVSPSDMMDGRVAVIREALDKAGLGQSGIMAYSAKFASAFYGPFRDAAGSAPSFGDRGSYQMGAANAREALREMESDREEGADILMVKPGMPYLDVLVQARRRFDLPLAVYQVSGEYSMIQAAAEKGWLDGPRTRDESLLAFKRAGADLIISYFAKAFAGDFQKRGGLDEGA
ncbi:MAG: porphobilinogen synthase [candidate division FCPU426 bacterium]